MVAFALLALGAEPVSSGAAIAAPPPPPTPAASDAATAAEGSAADAITQWLGGLAPPSVAAAWRRECDNTPAERLGEPLRALAPQADARVDTLGGGASRGWLESPEGPPSGVSASLRLAAAERCFFAGRYDAARELLDGVEPRDTYSPELVCYLRGASAMAVVDAEAARAALAELDQLARSGGGPARLGAARRWVVERIRADLAGVEPLPLATASRRMRDAGRRLALAEPGPGAADQQRRVLESLDELIRDLEKKRKQQASQAASAGGATPSGSPPEESRPSELKGPGDVDRKRLVVGDLWGALPPAERERLAQEVTRDMPGHYRALVERYFEALAEGGGAAADEAGDPAAGSAPDATQPGVQSSGDSSADPSADPSEGAP